MPTNPTKPGLSNVIASSQTANIAPKPITKQNTQTDNEKKQNTQTDNKTKPQP